MIARLTGFPEIINGQTVIIDCQGVGYEVLCPTSTVSRIPSLNTSGSDHPYTLHIYTHVREDQMTLFGFSSLFDRQLFCKLITVSGVGPKIGLAIMSHGSANEVISAIQQADVDYLTQIPGIGKKAAQKIIVELKTKLGVIAELDLQSDVVNTQTNELRDALKNLGYSDTEINEMVKKVPDEMTEVEEQLKVALRR